MESARGRSRECSRATAGATSDGVEVLWNVPSLVYTGRSRDPARSGTVRRVYRRGIPSRRSDANAAPVLIQADHASIEPRVLGCESQEVGDERLAGRGEDTRVLGPEGLHEIVHDAGVTTAVTTCGDDR